MGAGRRTVSALLAAFASLLSHARAQDPSLTLHVSTNLTLVDVTIAHRLPGLRTHEALTDLRREDFRVFDNGHEMPIQSFDIAAEHTDRPIALWLIVECNDDQPIGHHSMFLHGKTNLLQPALTHLAGNDLVGVAHWCDNGDAAVDLPAGHDPDAALSKIEDILNRKPVTDTNTRTGELAMQRMIRLMLDNTDERSTHRQPILLFLYGDRCGTHANEAESILKDLLESSAMVYGLNDGTWYDVVGVNQSSAPIGLTAEPSGVPTPFQEVNHSGETYHLVHYYSRETGGAVDSTRDPTHFSDALNELLTQLHLRYTIGFRPLNRDGKRHRLKVELTPEAHLRFGAAELHHRQEFIPIASP